MQFVPYSTVQFYFVQCQMLKCREIISWSCPAPLDTVCYACQAFCSYTANNVVSVIFLNNESLNWVNKSSFSFLGWTVIRLYKLHELVENSIFMSLCLWLKKEPCKMVLNMYLMATYMISCWKKTSSLFDALSLHRTAN